MSKLLVKPQNADDAGKVIDVTPQSAGWGYVGFAVHTLAAGQTISDQTGEREALLVFISGKGMVTAGGQDLGLQGDRMSVFERKKPYAVYVPNDCDWSVAAQTDVELGVCTAPGNGNHPVRVIGPDAIAFEERGKGANTRYIHPILMEDKDQADSLLVTEVFTPSGNWSSYPSHKHDEDKFPEETYLEETYYHRLDPPQGFGFQRVYTDDRSLDEAIVVADGDVVCVPKGYHPCAAPYGYDMYYLNVMAGPLRKWRFTNDPDHDWIFQRDSG